MYLPGADQKLLALINQLLISRSNGMSSALIEDQRAFLRWLFDDSPYVVKRIGEVAAFCSRNGAKDTYKSEVAAALIAGLHDKEFKEAITIECLLLIKHFNQIRTEWSLHPRSHESLIIIEILLDHLKEVKSTL